MHIGILNEPFTFHIHCPFYKSTCNIDENTLISVLMNVALGFIYMQSKYMNYVIYTWAVDNFFEHRS